MVDWAVTLVDGRDNDGSVDDDVILIGIVVDGREDDGTVVDGREDDDGTVIDG